MSNVDKAKPGLGLSIGGRARRLEFNHWALALIEEEKGPNFLRRLRYNATASAIQFLAWAGLVADDPSLDSADPERRRSAQRQVTEWCAELDPVELTRAVTQALINSTVLKKAAEKKADGGNQTKTATG